MARRGSEWQLIQLIHTESLSEFTSIAAFRQQEPVVRTLDEITPESDISARRRAIFERLCFIHYVAANHQWDQASCDDLLWCISSTSLLLLSIDEATPRDTFHLISLVDITIRYHFFFLKTSPGLLAGDAKLKLFVNFYTKLEAFIGKLPLLDAEFFHDTKRRMVNSKKYYSEVCILGYDDFIYKCGPPIWRTLGKLNEIIPDLFGRGISGEDRVASRFVEEVGSTGGAAMQCAPVSEEPKVSPTRTNVFFRPQKFKTAIQLRLPELPAPPPWCLASVGKDDMELYEDPTANAKEKPDFRALQRHSISQYDLLLKLHKEGTVNFAAGKRNSASIFPIAAEPFPGLRPGSTEGYVFHDALPLYMDEITKLHPLELSQVLSWISELTRLVQFRVNEYETYASYEYG
jgi:hypothetical protein